MEFNHTDPIEEKKDPEQAQRDAAEMAEAEEAAAAEMIEQKEGVSDREAETQTDNASDAEDDKASESSLEADIKTRDDGQAAEPISAVATDEATKIRYHWNYETQRATDEMVSRKNRRSGIVTYAIVMTAFFVVSFSVLVLSLLTGGLTGRPAAGNSSAGNSSSDRIIYIRDDDGQNGLLTIQEIFEQSKPGVVAVTARKTAGQGVGTGFVLREDGYIATNYHVVQGATSVQVLMYDGTTYDATVVNYSEPDDLAVLKVDAEDLHALPIGNSDQVLVGDDVVVIGNPAGLEYGWSTTDGIISAINREVTIKDSDGAVSKKMTLLQTNANVNSGNSGGPMFNEKGEVIGIISLKLANGYEGMGFAIPINGAMEIMNAIIEDGSADHVDSSVSKKPPMLGVTGVDVREGFALVFYSDGSYWHGPENLLPDDVEEKVYHISHNGFFVLTTAEHSDANGKLQEGDIIVAIDDVQTSNRSEVIAVLSEKSAGDVVRLACVRNGEMLTVELALSAAE